MLYSVEQLPRCDLLRLIPSLGGFVLSERRDLSSFFFIKRRVVLDGRIKSKVQRRVVVDSGKNFKVRRRVVVDSRLPASRFLHPYIYKAMVVPSPEGVHQATARPRPPAVRRRACRPVNGSARVGVSYRRRAVMPSLEPRLHSTGRSHLCHSCTRAPRARRLDHPDGCRGVPAGRPATGRAAREGHPSSRIDPPKTDA